MKFAGGSFRNRRCIVATGVQTPSFSLKHHIHLVRAGFMALPQVDPETRVAPEMDAGITWTFGRIPGMPEEAAQHLTGEMIEQFLKAGLLKSDAEVLLEHLRGCQRCRCRVESFQFWNEFGE